MKPIQFLLTLCLAGLLTTSLFGQSRSRTLVMHIDTKDMLTDPATMGNMVRMEVQKLNLYEVVDRYDMQEATVEAGLDPTNCFSKSCLIEAARAVNASKVIGGYAERINEKLVLTIKVIDVNSEVVERTEVGEFINQEPDIEKMVNIVVLRLFEQTPDQVLVDHLSFYNAVDYAPSKRLINNGPRMGFAYITGPMAQRLEAPLDEGGYNAQPVISQFGYQHEIQYMSAGSFQGLVEILAMVSGLEQSMFIPSVAVMNGFRENTHGFEFAFGPSFSLRKMEEGYMTDNGWVRAREVTGEVPTVGKTKQLDSRGNPEFFSRWVWSVGKTFRSGNLNIPVNVYASPHKEDWMVGLSVGFNLRKKR